MQDQALSMQNAQSTERLLQCNIKHRIITNSSIKYSYLLKLSEQGFTPVCGLAGDFFFLFSPLQASQIQIQN